MFQKIIQFVKYHNLFTIILGGILLLTVSAMASETVREAVLGEAKVEQQGIDNTALLAADLDNFDLAMTITGVREDAKQYYIDYVYDMYAIINNTWQTTTEAVILEVAKDALGSGDLGLYVAEELGEVADAKIAYLREVQVIEQNKGRTFIQETTTYTGLIGLVLNARTRELPSYEPVVKQLAMIESFVGIEGVDEAGERAKAAISGNAQLPISPEGEQVPYGAGNDQSISNDSITNEQTEPEVPDTILDTTPLALTTLTNAVFVFRSTIATTTFQCQVNSQGWLPCQSPKEYVNLTGGSYTFRVFATDEMGKYDSTPAEFSWVIDTQTTEVEPPAEVQPPQIEEPVEEPAPEGDPSAPYGASTTTEPVIPPEQGTATSTDDIATSTDQTTATSTTPVEEPPAQEPPVEPEPEESATTTEPVILPELEQVSGTTTDSTATSTPTQ